VQQIVVSGTSHLQQAASSVRIVKVADISPSSKPQLVSTLTSSCDSIITHEQLPGQAHARNKQHSQRFAAKTRNLQRRGLQDLL
jgi:hypothetical protein